MDTMRIVTRCTSLEQFISIFRRFVHESSCFIPSLDSRAPGTETAFSIRLADGTPVLRGLCEVIENWKTSDNPFKRPGVYIGIKRLTADSAPVFRELQVKPEEGERRRRPKDTVQEDVGADADDAAPTAKGTLPQPRIAAESASEPAPEARTERAKATTDGEALVPQDVSGDLTNVPMSAMITSGSETSRIQVTTTTNRAAEPLATIKMPRMSVPDIKPIVPIAKPAPKLPPISVPAKPEPKIHAKVDAEAKPAAEAEPAPKVEAQAAPAEAPTEPKLEVKPVEAPPEPTLEAKPVEATPEPTPEAESKPVEAATEPKPVEAKPEDKPAAPPVEVAKPPSKLDAMVALVKGPQKPSPTPTVETPPLQMQYEVETRAPGSGWVLPANPLTSLSDDKLEAFIDCTLYEETEDTGLAEVLSLPKEGALGMGAAPAREDKAPQDAAPEKSLTAQLANASQPVKGREQIATLLGVAPLVVPKAEPPVIVPSQVPKPFRTTAPKVEVAVAPVEAAREPTRSALKPALIAAGVAVAITIVILLASSSGKRDKTPPPAPAPTTTGAGTPDEPSPPPVAPVQDEAIEMEPVEAKPVEPNPGKPAAKPPETTACKLVVNTTPAGAWVRVDSDYKGKSPVTVDGPCKRRKIEVAANGFETQTKRIVMKGDETLELALVPKKATPKPATAKTKPATKPTKPKSTIDI